MPLLRTKQVCICRRAWAVEDGLCSFCLHEKEFSLQKFDLEQHLPGEWCRARGCYKHRLPERDFCARHEPPQPWGRQDKADDAQSDERHREMEFHEWFTVLAPRKA